MKTKRKKLLSQLKLQIPKIYLYSEGKRILYTTAIKKTALFLTSTAAHFLERGSSVRIKVFYGRAKTAQGKIEDFDNEMDCKSMEDLHWAFLTFTERGLYLPV